MIDTLKAELRKLLTVRSTYITSGLALAITIFVSFYIEGYRGLSGSPASIGGAGALEEIIVNVASTVAVFTAIVAVLFMAHEYRHNLIMYTLTASNSRTKVLLAKIATITVYAVLFTVLSTAVAIGSYYIGLALRDVSLPAQAIDFWYISGRVAFYCIANALLGLLLASLLRSIVGSIAILFIASSTIEPLLSLVLKENAIYLPFSALQQVITPGLKIAEAGTLSAGRAVLVSLAYLTAGWLITWWLFRRRDAN